MVTSHIHLKVNKVYSLCCSSLCLLNRSKISLVVAHASDQFTSLAENMLGLFADLSDAQISHGNLCATNILLSRMKPVLLNLDAMRLHRYQSRWYRAAKCDRKRFMRNWQNHPEVMRVFHLIGSEVKS